MAKSWKLKVNTNSKEEVLVAGVGLLTPGTWNNVDPDAFQTAQGVALEDAVSEMFSVKNPEGKELEPPKAQEEEEEKKEDS